MPLRWLATLAWGAFVSVLSLLPCDAVPQPDIVGFDKLVHFGVYAVLAGLALRAFGRPSRRTTVMIASSCAALGGFLEVAQEVLPIGRYGSVADAVANALGAVVACYVYARVARGRPVAVHDGSRLSP